MIVGNTINRFEKGDVIVIGSHIPHVFKSDYNPTKKSVMLSLFFTQQSFGDAFFELNELRELKPFFKKSNHGFKILGPTKNIQNLFLELKIAKKLDRFILLLSIMRIVSKKRSKRLSSFIYDKTYNHGDGKRLQNIYDYTMTHFKEDIDLEKISRITNMTKSAFCKYFKKRTNKTYFEFLNELRIAHACKLLNEDVDMSISEIAFASGYGNLANFNRQFKAKKKITPTAFRKLL